MQHKFHQFVLVEFLRTKCHDTPKSYTTHQLSPTFYQISANLDTTNASSKNSCR